MNATPVLTGITHIQVAIPPGGEERARAFYGELLSLREVPKPSTLSDRGGCWFVCGPQEVHCGVEDPIAPTRRHPAFSVVGLDQLRDRLEASGTATTTDRPLPGYRRFYALDPFGNRLEFLEAETPGAHSQPEESDASR
jgi:catechol 2,3-dioxygenase-like lactoylglutathione lyase family enzyme